MKNFEKAYLKFFDKYKNEDWFEGAVLCGSYATGNNNENSDIDIFIVASNVLDWRERGNIIIDGFMIEYFINPIRQIESEILDERKLFARHTSNMFHQGIIIHDKNGEIKKLKNLANDTLKIQPEVNNYKYTINCYSTWERFDEVDSKYKNGDDIDLSFYYFMQNAIDTISYNKKIGSFSFNKIEKFLKDKEFRKRYGIKKFFNKTECELLIKCLEEKEREQKYKNAKALYNYINKKFNFDINNFSFRSKI